MTNSKSGEGFQGLDALRGVLSIVVCFAHSWQVFIAPIEGSTTVSGYLFGLSARFAVLWFFCLSGYVIALSIKKNVDRFGDFRPTEYFSSRAFRILPPLLSVIALVYVIAKVAAIYGVASLPEGVSGARGSYSVNLKYQLYCLTTLCAQGDLTGTLNGPLWSLHYEIQLYTVMGLAAVVLFYKRYWFVRLLAAGALVGYWQNAFYLRSLSGDLSPQILWYITFGIGVCGFCFFSRASLRVLYALSVVGLGIGTYLFAAFDPAKLLAEIDRTVQLISAQVAIGVACTAIIILLSRTSVSQRLGDLGKFSYTLYIVHFPLLLILYFVLANSRVSYSLSLAWGIAIAAAVGCSLFARAISGVIENTAVQRELVRKGIGVLMAKTARGVSE